MGILTRKETLSFLILFKLFVLIFGSDNTNVVYKGCSEQKLGQQSSQNLQSLLSSLVSASGQKTFAATTTGDGQNAITGVYQCRGDLSTSDCYLCVSKIPNKLNKLCGGDVAAARIQLSGCYLRYEVAGFKQEPQTQLLYKVCGSKKVKDGGVGFEEKRDSAFGMVENGVKSGGSLFYTGNYMSLYVLGQCEGNLGNDDCGDCVKSAQEQAKLVCGDSISAQIYLFSCFVSYSFYPNGAPSMSSSSSSSSGGNPHAERTVALAVGGVAAIGFLIVCLMFLKSVFKKRSGKY
ncbi:plasmodesmata-located protein 1-like isoform X2 [Cicer arietinum]|uniref:Cysteine-rich repeat secretory protein 56-like isoform X2 n=1 Tax=Cicer arietinum TaxID=3827 RepID=A0A3Q7Y8M3_CICAR|nr:cysteine-rich repeat secretory protein 56-like isoform X2 [Cicer arietinum]